LSTDHSASAQGDEPRSGAGQRARIGPNAILRVAETLTERIGAKGTAMLFERAGLGDHLRHPPADMVDEHDVTELYRTLREGLGLAASRALLRDAGLRTGDYLLAHRIPRPVQYLLHVLPAGLASRVLLAAIARNAWTFCGSGRFCAAGGAPARMVVEGCPLCAGAASAEPICDYYAGTFERLFRVLVHPRAHVTECACRARGDAACVFEAAW
jgi:divinyl protochlorophyllide a 8-vinyl-reductase